MRQAVLLLGLLAILSPACADKTCEVAVVETDAGVFVIRFFDEIAPNHIGKFKVLSRSGLYDGTCFQKIVPGEFVLSGDPYTVDDLSLDGGTDESAFSLDAEISRLHHRRGIVSMARGKELRTSGAQFFICQSDLPHLDGLFTIFGEVVEGLAVIDSIGSIPVDLDGRPARSVCIRSIEIETRPVQ